MPLVIFTTDEFYAAAFNSFYITNHPSTQVVDGLFVRDTCYCLLALFFTLQQIISRLNCSSYISIAAFWLTALLPFASHLSLLQNTSVLLLPAFNPSLLYSRSYISKFSKPL